MTDALVAIHIAKYRSATNLSHLHANRASEMNEMRHGSTVR